MAENTFNSVQTNTHASTVDATQAGVVIYPEMDARIRANQEKEHRNKRIKRKIPKVLAWALVVVVVAFLILLIASKIAHFESIFDMLDFISRHFAYSDIRLTTT